jgi:hypothetical protein
VPPSCRELLGQIVFGFLEKFRGWCDAISDNFWRIEFVALLQQPGQIRPNAR